jgi:hypothetical protein
MDDGVRGRYIHMSKEELEKKLSSVGIFGEWVDKDKYGFSRVFQFTIEENGLSFLLEKSIQYT